MPTTAKPIATPPHFSKAKGTTGNNHLIKPKVPIFSIIPDSNMVPCVGAVTYVSGCHVCKGKIGILIAKAIKIVQNTNVCCASVKLLPATYKSFIAHDFRPVSNPVWLYKNIKPININKEPNKVYTKNLKVIFARFSPPHSKQIK